MKILTEYKYMLVKLAETLITKETLDYDELETLFKETVPAASLPEKVIFPELLKKTVPAPSVAQSASESPPSKN